MVRCVNLDWLEVYCIERSGGMSANDFRQAGIQVEERDYGTRISLYVYAVRFRCKPTT